MTTDFKILKAFNVDRTEKVVRFSFCGYSEEHALAFSEKFKAQHNVEVVQGNIFSIKADALVSPANSFGEMSGGLDKAIDVFYEYKAQKKAIEHIARQYFGELPVGCATVVEMHSRKFPYLILAPTMRIPGNVSKTLNAYLAMRGLLVAIAQFNTANKIKITSVAIPGFCTGVGGMAIQESVEQMFKAYENVVLSGWRSVRHPAIAPYAMHDEFVY